MPVLKVIRHEQPYYAHHGPGKYKDDMALHDVISYCARYGKTSRVDGIGVYPPQAIYEMERLSQAYGKTHGVRLRHWILSFSKGELRKISRKALPDMLHHFGWYAANYYGRQYQIIFSVHLDSATPHIHFVMNTVNYLTGNKYAGDRADYYAYLKYLRDFFGCYGMEVIAANNP